MHISFRTAKLQREFESERDLRRNRGTAQANKIATRMLQLEAAENLEQLRGQPGRFHELRENLDGRLVCDLDGPYRLIFECADDPSRTSEQGGLDWAQVKAIRILGVLDYHEDKKKRPV